MEELYGFYLKYPHVQTDSRKVKSGEIFFALKGENFNGNAFAAQALEQGAAYAVVDETAYAINEKTILVDDVLTTLQSLARHHRQQFSIPFLGITGSNGKTTTKELIHAVLSSHFKTSTTTGNLNNHIGVPLTLLRIPQDTEMAVIEMGANHIGEIASYCRVALPTHGLITNCGKAHLEGFGGVEGVRKGKGELFDHLRANGGTAFVMWDYDYLRDMSRGIPHVNTYGTADADVIGQAAKTDPYLQVQFTRGLLASVKTQLVGGYNLPNVLAAVAVGLHFGVPQEKIVKALESYTPSNSRSQLVKKGTNEIVLDAYNANPSSMKLAVENLAQMKKDALHKILVLGAMAELGTDSLQEHRDLVTEIEKYKWKDVLLVGGDFQKIDHPFHRFATPEEAGKWLRENKPEEKTILVKGSRSMQMEKVLEYL